MMAFVIEGWLSEPSMIRAEFTLPILTYASVRGVRVTLNDAYIHQGYGR